MKSYKGVALIEITVIGLLFLLLVAGGFITLQKRQVELPFLPQSSPKPTPSPQPTSQPPKLKLVNLNEGFSMGVGDEVEVSETGLKLKITVIATPQEGTFDLPSRVEGQATYQGQTEKLSFTIGGNQPEEIANQRRQKNVFNLFNIYVQKVTVSEVTLIVERI